MNSVGQHTRGYIHWWPHISPAACHTGGCVGYQTGGRVQWWPRTCSAGWHSGGYAGCRHTIASVGYQTRGYVHWWPSTYSAGCHTGGYVGCRRSVSSAGYRIEGCVSFSCQCPEILAMTLVKPTFWPEAKTLMSRPSPTCWNKIKNKKQIKRESTSAVKYLSPRYVCEVLTTVCFLSAYLKPMAPDYID